MNEYQMRWEQEHRLREAARKQRQQELLRAIPKAPRRQWVWMSRLIGRLRGIARRRANRANPLLSPAEKAV